MKRGFDIILTLVTLFVFGIPMIIVGILVRIKLGGPILFTQNRPGLNCQIFKMYKFRSMTNECDSGGNLLPDDQRLTKFGKLLRATSLDELPALWNVLKGDISLVGPRPLLVEYIPLYNADQARRHDVKPGITGWAQVNGRNAISWEKKFKYDVWYVENQSLWLDIKILAMTVKKVFAKQDISQDGEATMKAFVGTLSEDMNEREGE